MTNQTHVGVNTRSTCNETVIQSAINQKPMFVDCQSAQNDSQSVCSEFLCNDRQEMHNQSLVDNGHLRKIQSVCGGNQSIYSQI